MNRRSIALPSSLSDGRYPRPARVNAHRVEIETPLPSRLPRNPCGKRRSARLCEGVHPPVPSSGGATSDLTSGHLDRDWRVRLEAFKALGAITDRSGGVVTRDELQAGFLFEGIRIPFASRGAGIWRPAVLAGEVGAALSIMTSEGGRYSDAVGADGWLKYSYQDGSVDNQFNRALRNAHRYRRPVIYLCRLQKGVFEVFYPVFIESDDADQRIVKVAIDTPGLGEQGLRSGGSPEILKRYATVEALKRLHQDQFRFEVVGAYRRACSVCSLGDEDRLVRLLDAAHILPDGDPRSLPEVSNGIALCKIHHSAYDLNILGIDPDYRVRVRRDILAKVDGPMLQHGIKEMDGRKITVPLRDTLKPNREFLAERFEGFKAA